VVGWNVFFPRIHRDGRDVGYNGRGSCSCLLLHHSKIFPLERMTELGKSDLKRLIEVISIDRE